MSSLGDDVTPNIASYQESCQKKYEKLLAYTILEVSTDIKGKKWEELTIEDQEVVVSTMGSWDPFFMFETTLKRTDDIINAGLYAFVTGENYYE